MWLVTVTLSDPQAKFLLPYAVDLEVLVPKEEKCVWGHTTATLLTQVTVTLLLWAPHACKSVGRKGNGSYDVR